MTTIDALYAAEQASMIHLAVLMLGSRAEAEEVVQDAVEYELPAHLGELRSALNALNERQRTVVVLRYFLDMDDASIAEVIQAAEATVRTINHRALAILRKELS